MNRVFDLSELVKRLIKYLVEGLMVALAAYAIPKKSLDLEEIGMIALAAAATFSILDTHRNNFFEESNSSHSKSSKSG